ncbi:DUF4340 domain-containing protein [Stieleria sp. TO1_6]|uniref:DUF4340 domain-containing protein n=1 Tax=Stieleria tagensis TaxID=2956795 RepID=UPI00209A9906|nr:DUF4340 domain-containing protein [Stieleria tagensis]MCO8122731.1 DUF4340 domain-containing protein [Stieleria tagensis]
MNETKKTGIFWGVAAVVALIAAIVAWPTAPREDSQSFDPLIGEPLFAEFKDPLGAASLKIITFDDQQGELANFEVRKNPQTGLWTIPSKGGYPADAVEQMRDAANSLVDLKILDVPTDNPEDHTGMGVVEPKLEDLEVGDEGVGRMVTFKDQSQKVLASLIIGNQVKEQPGQLYVRKPGQDPVYVVSLDDAPLTTNFQDWIEEDLLQLTSIDVDNVEIKDYSASLGLQGVSLVRDYNASVTKDGTEWDLDSLKEFDKNNPLAEPSEVSVSADEKLNAQKLNDLVNALDDLKFVDVNRKPDGISANLRADKDFATDQEAAGELATRGFIPVPMGPNGEIEILSANGELNATTKSGVKYVLRFGNISGIADDSDADGEEDSTSGGANRYLMVSTEVDESRFPAPELQPIPQTLEELDAMEQAAQPAPAEPEDAPEQADEAADKTETAEEPAAPTDEPEMKDDAAPAEPAAESPAAEDAKADDATADEPAADKKPAAEDAGDDAAQAGEGEAKETESGATDASGEGESTTVGEAQQADQDAEQAPAESPGPDSNDEDAPADETAAAAGNDAQPAESAADDAAQADAPAEDKEMTEQPAQPAESAADNAADDASDNTADSAADKATPELTEGEKRERLAAIQEKITKENERKLEERKENLAQAKLQSRQLNERFADWYYVIPEDTYTKLRIGRDELFGSEEDAAAVNPAAMPPQMPNFGGFPGN